jgi:L-proline amide hydrolase
MPITSGRYDESTPLINEIMHNSIEGSEWIIFEQSSHMAHVEEKERYMQTVRAFIESVEGRTS